MYNNSVLRIPDIYHVRDIGGYTVFMVCTLGLLHITIL